jgi:DNA-binding NarL/FixJ family response regulator
MNSKPIRAALFSNQAIYLRGLEQLFLSIDDLHLVGEAHTAHEMIQLCAMTQPDIAVLHLFKPACPVAALIEDIQKQNGLHLPVILLTDCEIFDQVNAQGSLSDLYFLDADVSEDEFKAALAEICAHLPAAPQQNKPVQQYHHTIDLEEPEDPASLGNMPPQDRSGELITHELAMAGQVQATILPENLPDIPNWEIAAALLPARETSGDFYDFIPMAYGIWGIVVADVTDKGMGAALFMALSSTLIRTYAARFPTLPALTMNTVNERILSDTRGSLFVTTLLAVLEPHTGRMVYANAGHPPAFLIGARNGKASIEALKPTGMVLGVEPSSWKQKSIRIAPGDLLVLYSDGITEIQDPQGNLFGEEGLLDVLLTHQNSSVQRIKSAVIEALQKFAGSPVRQDDIALLVLRRNA